MIKEKTLDQIKAIINQNKITDFSFDEIISQIKSSRNKIVFFGNISGQKVTVKYCINESADAAKKILNEISVLRFFSKKNSDIKSKIFAYDTGKHPWIIKGFLRGIAAGKLLSFKTNFIDNISPDKVIDIIKKYKNYNPKIIWKYEDLVNVFNKNLAFIDRYYLNKFDNQDKWKMYFNQSIMPLKYKKYLSHNDLNAGNVLYNKKGNFKIIDWESVGYDTYQKDFANIFHMAYNYPDWQKRFIEKMNFTNCELMEFNAWAIYLLLYNSSGLKKIQDSNNKEYFRSGNLTRNEIEKYIEMSLIKAQEFSKIF